MAKERFGNSREMGKGPTGRSACSIRAVAGIKEGDQLRKSYLC